MNLNSKPYNPCHSSQTETSTKVVVDSLYTLLTEDLSRWKMSCTPCVSAYYHCLPLMYS